MLRSNVRMFMIIAAWFLINYCIIVGISGDPSHAGRVLVYMSDPRSDYERFYATFSEYVVFGLLIGIVTVEAFRNYNPLETCQIIASKMRGHVILMGYNHLGIRIANYLHEANIPHIIVSRDETEVADLVKDERPVVIYDPNDKEFTNKIRLKQAKFLILAENETITNMQIVILADESKASCEIMVRCFDEGLEKVFKAYGCETISSSSIASNYLVKDFVRYMTGKLHLVGFNHFSEKIAIKAAEQGIKCTIIEHQPENIEEMREFYSMLPNALVNLITVIEGNPMDFNLIKEAGIFKSDAVVITLEADEEVIVLAKELKLRNANIRVYVRSFTSEIEKILRDFKCIGISTTQKAFEMQVKPALVHLRRRY
ncbi:MAG: NAD-binding protein [Candidatus Hodarchaeota archaeon]